MITTTVVLQNLFGIVDHPVDFGPQGRNRWRANKSFDAVVEIAKHINDPSKLEELLSLFDERKKEPIDYRRSGVITLFVGAGLFFLGYFLIGNLLIGAGGLVGLIGTGTLIAGYLYPRTEKELTNAVDEYERK